MKRLTRDEYFMELACTAAQRATCDRARVGCVIVSKNNHVIATGYNGSLPGELHCDQVGHLIEHDHCVRTIHAEVNAIAACAREGISTEGASVYISHSPCERCYRILKQAGIVKISALKAYGSVQPDVQLVIQDFKESETK